jgi:hypothetical protein
MERLRINETLEKTLPQGAAKLVKAMIADKLAMQGSKLAIFNWLERETELAQRFDIDMKNIKFHTKNGRTKLKIKQQMKRTIFAIGAVWMVSSCTSVKQIGQVNIISNRNIDPKLSYEVITTYSGGGKKELKKTKSVTIENAIDYTVRKVQGGEFLMNAKIYRVNGRYIAVEGDVWGIKSNIGYRGFKIGDKVTWKVVGNYKSGVIKSLKDDKSCLIETDNGEIVEKKYDDISKIE